MMRFIPWEGGCDCNVMAQNPNVARPDEEWPTKPGWGTAGELRFHYMSTSLVTYFKLPGSSLEMTVDCVDPGGWEDEARRARLFDFVNHCLNDWKVQQHQ